MSDRVFRVEVDADASFDRSGASRQRLDDIWRSVVEERPKVSERYSFTAYFVVTVLVIGAKPFWSKVMEKAGEKVGEEIGSDLSKVYRALSDTVVWGLEAVGDAALRLILRVAGEQDEATPIVELTCTSNLAEDFAKANGSLREAAMIADSVRDTLSSVGFRLATIHLVWDSDWRFSYALTEDGNAVTPDQLRMLTGSPA